MSRITGGNTKPEMTVRRILHGMGFRFRLHVRQLPGNPDIVLPRHKKIIFVNGCFWHGHKDCPRAKLPSSNLEFWSVKIAANIERDNRSIEALEEIGWKTLTVWECETKKTELLIERLQRFLKADID